MKKDIYYLSTEALINSKIIINQQLRETLHFALYFDKKIVIQENFLAIEGTVVLSKKTKTKAQCIAEGAHEMSLH